MYETKLVHLFDWKYKIYLSVRPNILWSMKTSTCKAHYRLNTRNFGHFILKRQKLRRWSPTNGFSQPVWIHKEALKFSRIMWVVSRIKTLQWKKHSYCSVLIAEKTFSRYPRIVDRCLTNKVVSGHRHSHQLSMACWIIS
jgi:hypothetical protein